MAVPFFLDYRKLYKTKKAAENLLLFLLNEYN